MKRVIVICPTGRDKRELSYQHVSAGYEILFNRYHQEEYERVICPGFGSLTYTFNPELFIEDVIKKDSQQKIDGLLSTEDYPGAVLASIVAQKIGLASALPAAVLLCQHKYHARCIQKESVPHATPSFSLIDPDTFPEGPFSFSFPLFIKPIKSVFSIFANYAYHIQDIYSLIKSSRLPNQFLEQFNWFLKNYSSCSVDARHLLVEEVLSGVQTTLEGCVYEGKFTVIGIVDSVMIPETISFKQFNYPSSLAADVQERMALIAEQFIKAVAFDNGVFNIEFMYNPTTDQIHIIEINPRMSSQFADLFEKVNGKNTYSLLLDIATGNKPEYVFGQGRHTHATSFVLRTHIDQYVSQIPTEKEREKLRSEFPDVRLEVHATVGKKLSDERQDGKSYRYGLINLGGNGPEELADKCAYVQRLLTFRFRPV